MPGTPITVDFLCATFVDGFEEEELPEVVKLLDNQWIRTTERLEKVSRDALMSKLPAFVVDVLKPETSVSKILSC